MAIYISDLDGTLFNKDKVVSEKSLTLLNTAIENGAKFAVATARMPYGCDYRLEKLHLNIPSIVANGVFLYDFSAAKTVSAELISEKDALAVIEQFEKNKLGVFLYTYEADRISIYYNDPSVLEQKQYYSDRAIACCREIAYEKKLSERVKSGNAFYFSCTGTGESLACIYENIAGLPGVNCSYYLNVYNGLYCLEIFSEYATKQNAVKKLKTMYDEEEIVVFGDNLNDLSMFEIADRSYAVKNALEVVKKNADGIIGNNNEDGVALFISREMDHERL